MLPEMAWREFKSSRGIACTPAQAFTYIADYRNVHSVLEGVTRWLPLGRKTTGVGARFEVEMRTLGIPLGNVLVLDAWKPNRLISWQSESGLLSQRGSWTFEPSPDGVRVTLRIAYEPPGAAIGNLLASRVDSVVRARLAAALAEMAGVLEEPAG